MEKNGGLNDLKTQITDVRDWPSPEIFSNVYFIRVLLMGGQKHCKRP
jgi:hypothetical protein